MSRSIRVSEKHGVNPALDLCYFCGEPAGVVLFGRLAGDAEAPRQVTSGVIPCSTCEDLMRRGIMCIEVRDGESGENPYRTGRMVVVTEAGLRKVLTAATVDAIVSKRSAFIPKTIWEAVGFDQVPPTEAK